MLVDSILLISDLIKKLADEGIKLNITAIFTLKQIKEIISEVHSSNHILSIEWLSLSSQGHKRIKFNWNNSELSYQWLIP